MQEACVNCMPASYEPSVPGTSRSGSLPSTRRTRETTVARLTDGSTTGRVTRVLLTIAILFVGVAGPVVQPATAAADQPAFESTIVDTYQGEVAEIEVRVPESHDEAVQVTIGSERANFLVRSSVVDADGDGSVVLSLDTDAAGAGDPSSYLEISDGDELQEATQETPKIRPPLDEGDYDLTIGPVADPVDIGTLVVESRGGTDGESGDGETTTGDGSTTRGLAGTFLVYQGEELTLESGPDQTIQGETTLESGTALTVQLRSAGGDHPFLKSTEVSVTEYGTFTATFDLSDVPAGTAFTVHARGDGQTLGRWDGRIAECDGKCPTSTEGDRMGADALSGDKLAVKPTVEVVRGNVAQIPVALGDAQRATILIGGPTVNYEVAGTVTDRDGDGRVVVQFRTDAAGFEPRSLSYRDAGSNRMVEGYSESELQMLLDAGDYPIRLYRGTTTDGDPAAVATLVVHDAPTMGTATDAPITTPTITSGSNTTDSAGRTGFLGEDGAAIFAIGLGGILAVVGIGVVFGLIRS